MVLESTSAHTCKCFERGSSVPVPAFLGAMTLLWDLTSCYSGSYRRCCHSYVWALGVGGEANRDSPEDYIVVRGRFQRESRGIWGCHFVFSLLSSPSQALLYRVSAVAGLSLSLGLFLPVCQVGPFASRQRWSWTAGIFCLLSGLDPITHTRPERVFSQWPSQHPPILQLPTVWSFPTAYWKNRGGQGKRVHPVSAVDSYLATAFVLCLLTSSIFTAHDEDANALRRPSWSTCVNNACFAIA